MKKQSKKLVLSKETIRSLNPSALNQIRGGDSQYTVTACPMTRDHCEEELI